MSRHIEKFTPIVRDGGFAEHLILSKKKLWEATHNGKPYTMQSDLAPSNIFEGGYMCFCVSSSAVPDDENFVPVAVCHYRLTDYHQGIYDRLQHDKSLSEQEKNSLSVLLSDKMKVCDYKYIDEIVPIEHLALMPCNLVSWNIRKIIDRKKILYYKNDIERLRSEGLSVADVRDQLRFLLSVPDDIFYAVYLGR